MNDDNQTTPAKPWWGYKGMSAIEYAAIHTGQPCSGTPWLDEMIRAQRRERLAGQALAGVLAGEPIGWTEKEVAEDAIAHADALIAALEGGAK